MLSLKDKIGEHRILNDDNGDNNSNTIKKDIKKTLTIKSINTKHNINDLDYIVNKMNILGDSSLNLLYSLNPNGNKLKKNHRITKVKPKDIKFTSINSPSLLLKSAGIAAGIKASSIISNKINDIKKSKKEDDIFKLSQKDKEVLKKLKSNVAKEGNLMDNVIKKFSAGAIPSLAALFFGFKYYKESDVYKMFKSNISEFSNEAFKLFEKLIKHSFKWIKTNLVPDNIKNLTRNTKARLNDLKNYAIQRLHKAIGRESSNDMNNKLIQSKKDPILSAKSSMTNTVQELLLTFLGNDTTASVPYKTRKRQKSFKEYAQHSTGIIVNKPDSFDNTSGDFVDVSYTGGKESVLDVDSDSIKVGKLIKGRIVDIVAVYKAIRSAGFSHHQAMALCGEIGRENDFQAKYIFGTHTDLAKSKSGQSITNIGWISWNGARAKKLVARMKKKGLIVNGKMVRSYESLKAMAEFMMWEMKNTHKKYGSKFLKNKTISIQESMDYMGGAGRYVAWARGQKSVRGGKSFNSGKHEKKILMYYNKIKKKLGDSVYTKRVKKSNKESRPLLVYIGDSIAFGYKAASKIKAGGDPVVGNSVTQVLKQIKVLLKKYDNDLSNVTVVLSTGFSNSPSKDYKKIEEQFRLLKKANADVRVLGVGNTFNRYGIKGAKVNQDLERLSHKHDFEFLGGFKTAKDNVHPVAYKDLGIKPKPKNINVSNKAVHNPSNTTAPQKSICINKINNKNNNKPNNNALTASTNNSLGSNKQVNSSVKMLLDRDLNGDMMLL